MLTKNIKFINFPSTKKKNYYDKLLKKNKVEFFIKKYKFIVSLAKDYKYSYTKKKLQK